MSIFKGILTDLRQRRLWPVPLALIVAIVAVPVVLAKSPHAAPLAPLPPSPSPTAGTPVAAISVDNSPTGSHPVGPARDPFTQQVLPSTVGASVAAALGGGPAPGLSATTTGGSNPTSGAGSSGSTGGTSASTGSSSGSGSSGGSSAPSAPAASPLPANAKPTPSPSGLTSTEAYQVSLSITDGSGGVNSIDSLERLSPLPSADQPLVVELGVLQGGKRVLFAVQPGTSVSGAGTCITGPIDCEIISLGQDQVENISSGSASASFAVTGITATHYGSAAAASAARQAVDQSGSELMANSSLGALSLFEYQPQIGALVDLRNLTVGGN